MRKFKMSPVGKGKSLRFKKIVSDLDDGGNMGAWTAVRRPM